MLMPLQQRFYSSTHSTRRREMRTAILAACVFVAACSGEPHGAPVRVIIPRGASFGQAADSLSRNGVIGSAKLFTLYGRVVGGDRNIKPGTYLLKHGTPWNSIIDALNGGHGLVNTVTIPEGWTISQITPALAKTLKVPADSVTAAVRDTALLARLDIPNPTLEGYLFPDTYAFPIGTTARQAVREMVYSFERRWKPSWDTAALAMKINRNDLVTMASIVEKEARVPEERPVIAAVYYNRLRKGMLLQADPTVQYALGHHVGRVLYKDLAIKSPYNTYINKGLPPGPIASPGAASLAAAANPASVQYLYFVASPDGHHEFRMTLEQHATAVRQVRAAMPKRTTPRLLAMADPAPKASTSRLASTKAAPARPTSKSTATTKTTKAPTTAKKLVSTSAKSNTKTPAKSTSRKSTTTSTKKRVSGTTSSR